MNSMIKKTYRTETAHRVLNAISERCKYNIHGHSYVWEIEICGELNKKTGMVLDFKELTPIKEFIDKFDHANVLWEQESQDILDFYKLNYNRIIIMKQNCTAENMARVIFKFVSEWLDQINLERNLDLFCTNVTVWETTTGCGIATEADFDDIIIYMHNDKF